ncbi:MAG: hypothetical protein DCC65_08775 [Planctomycetota bacterium]|nr:MAG: hypothetical protein DCC65_08775 [Planctomycetota bacterium]
MLDVRTARDRAMRLAVLTGHMPPIDLIHMRQRAEGFEACFGRCTSTCPQTGCRWHNECSRLAGACEPAARDLSSAQLPHMTYRA